MKRKIKKALFRLDSGGRIGLGHVMRSKALADALEEMSIECTFAVRKIHSNEAVNPHHLIFIHKEEEFISLAYSYDIIIVDHYDFTSDLFFLLANIERSLLVVLDDECKRGNLYADIIINPVNKAHSLPYKAVSPKAQLLIGPEYLLLRRSFQEIQLPAFEHRDSIVITFGGSDVTNLTLPVLKCLKNTSLVNFNIIVVTGAGIRNCSEIADFCFQNGFEHQHDVENMAYVFSQARLAISAAGSTAFELACCGVPAVFAIVADNQFMSMEEQSQHKWCNILDCRESHQPEQLVYKADKMIKSLHLGEMSQFARSLVDARGAERIASLCYTRIINY